MVEGVIVERMVQVGVAALRAPNGDFLPSVPLYVREKDAGELNPHTGRTVKEDLALDDISKVFADKFKQYVDGTKKLKRTQKNSKQERNKEETPCDK